MANVEDLLNSNGIHPHGYQPGRQYLTCPKCSSGRKRHNQKKPCLSLMIEDDKAYWKCHHCGWTGPEKTANGRGFDDRIRYAYPNGNYKVRNPRGRQPPYIWEHEDDHGNIVTGSNGLGYSLYRLEEAIEHGGLIAVVEGEKDADNLWAIGVPAITSPHGAAQPGQAPKWLPQHSEQLAGLDIVVLNDHDAQGYAHAKAIVDCSIGIAKSVRRLDLRDHWPDIQSGHDISDFLQYLHYLEPYPGDEWVRDLLEDAPLINGNDANTTRNDAKPNSANSAPQPDPQAKPASAASAPWFADIALDGQFVPEQEWTVPNRIPARSVCLFTGHGAAGKSTIGLNLCAAHALGKDWLGSLPEQGPAFFIDCEDEFNVIWRRLEAVRAHYGVSYQDLIDGGLSVKTMAGEGAILAAPDKNGLIHPTKFYNELLAQATAIKPVQIIIASAANVFAGNENDRSQVQQFYQLLMRLALVTAGSVTLVAHPSRLGMSGDNGGGFSGSTQWHNAFRSRIYIESVKDEEASDLRKISFLKNQYGPEDESLTVRWRDGLFLPEAKMGSYDQAVREAKVDGVIITLVKKYTALHQPLSPKFMSRTYLPNVLARDDLAKGISKKELAAGMERLLERGTLVVRTWGPPSDPHPYIELP